MKNFKLSRYLTMTAVATVLLAATTFTSCEKDSTTPPTAPPTDAELAVAAQAATGISKTAATLHGSYDSTYSEYIADTGFDYRKSGETSWVKVWLGSSAATFEHTLVELVKNSDYEFRALVKRSDGTVVESSPALTFTTAQNLYDSPFIIEGVAAGTEAVVTFIDATTQNITIDREITVQLPVKMIYSISSPAFSGGDILIGRMSDETIRLSFGGGSLKFRVNGNKRLINTYAELAMINASEDDLAYSYLQESALDLLGSEDVTAHGLERRNWLPIGVDYMNSFTGNYDGGKKEISNLYVNRESEDYIGLFGSSVGTLGNICVVSGLVNGNNYVGGICGFNYEGIITSCDNAAQVSGALHSGGVCGFSNYHGTIALCRNTGQVSGTDNRVGGVCGYNSISVISECYNAGQVSGTGKNNIGGICGENGSGSILTSCHNTGPVEGEESVAGICGLNTGGMVNSSRNDGAVSGAMYVGGVCGFNLSSATVTACYNTGDVSGDDVTGGVLVGGVCGFNNQESTLSDSYNTAQVIGKSNVGGVCGLNTNSTVTANYWLKYSNGPENGVGAPPSDTEAAPFGASSWPTTWTLYSGSAPDPLSGPFWKSLGQWSDGGTTDGINSTFPKLWWEE